MSKIGLDYRMMLFAVVSKINRKEAKKIKKEHFF